MAKGTLKKFENMERGLWNMEVIWEQEPGHNGLGKKFREISKVKRIWEKFWRPWNMT
jgi:hypothetical protein